MIKKLVFLVLMLLCLQMCKAGVEAHADMFYDGSACRDEINIFIDTTDTDGYIELRYTDCDGDYRERRIECESLNLCVDTAYDIGLTAYPDTGYKFDTWSNIEVTDSNSVSIAPCHDLTIEPVMKAKHINDGDSGCFIKTVK